MQRSTDKEYHPKGSPYYGLSLEQQRLLSIIRRGAKKTPKAILRKLRKATKQDYDNIVLACTEALVYGADDSVEVRLDRIRVSLRLYYKFRDYFDPDFPRATYEAYDDWSTVVSFKVDTLMNWLYKKGYSPYNARELRTTLWAVSAEQDRMMYLYDVASAASIVEGYDGVLKGAPMRKDKGRRKYRKKSVDNTTETCDNVESK